MKALEINIEEYIPLIKPTIKAKEKSLIEPVVNMKSERTANKVVTVVKTERVNVSDKDLFKIVLKFLTSVIIFKL